MRGQRSADPVERAAYWKWYRETHKDATLAGARRAYHKAQTNARRLESKRAYRVATRIERAERLRKWKALNPTYAIDRYANDPSYRTLCKVRSSMRRALRAQRTPAWADLELIAFIYDNCPAGLEVDHVVPLKGRRVSGLHVAPNLQYLTKEENIRKNNRFDI